MIIYAGDREECVVGALLGAYLEIPTVHFYGGDHASDGNVDNAVRHAVSKLSSFHFVAHEEHKRRLLSLGESEERISQIGSVALDRIREHEAGSVEDLLSKFSLEIGNRDIALVIYHPIVGEREQGDSILKSILEALEQRGLFAFVSSPNSDPGNRKLLALEEKYRDRSQAYFTEICKEICFCLCLSILKSSSATLLPGSMRRLLSQWQR